MARVGVYVAFFAHGYSCTACAVFLTATDAIAPSRAYRARDARGAFRGVPRAANDLWRPSRPSPRSFAWTSRAARRIPSRRWACLFGAYEYQVRTCASRNVMSFLVAFRRTLSRAPRTLCYARQLSPRA